MRIKRKAATRGIGLRQVQNRQPALPPIAQELRKTFGASGQLVRVENIINKRRQETGVGSQELQVRSGDNASWIPTPPPNLSFSLFRYRKLAFAEPVAARSWWV